MTFILGIKEVSISKPKNLNLFTIQQPVPAIVSILHRIAGFLLVLCIPIGMWALQFSLTEKGFNALHQWLKVGYIKLIVIAIAIPYCFHLLAGIRHLFADIHIGDTLPAGKVTAISTFIGFILLVILAGIWLW